MSEHYKFNQHLKCEFFPCHKVEDSSKFNCLFCYCPLYLLKEDCGGNFKHTENGIKDCSECMVPHLENSYELVMSKMSLVMERGKKE